MTALPEPFSTAIASLLRFVIGGIFIWSGGIKLRDLDGFGLVITTYSIVPRALHTPSRAFAYLIPFVELVSGALVFVWEYPVSALVLIIASLIGYTVIEVHELVFGPGVDNCGCYGTAIKIPLSWWQVLKNIVLFILAAYLLSTPILTP